MTPSFEQEEGLSFIAAAFPARWHLLIFCLAQPDTRSTHSVAVASTMIIECRRHSAICHPGRVPQDVNPLQSNDGIRIEGCVHRLV